MQSEQREGNSRAIFREVIDLRGVRFGRFAVSTKKLLLVEAIEERELTGIGSADWSCLKFCRKRRRLSNHSGSHIHKRLHAFIYPVGVYGGRAGGGGVGRLYLLVVNEKLRINRTIIKRDNCVFPSHKRSIPLLSVFASCVFSGIPFYLIKRSLSSLRAHASRDILCISQLYTHLSKIYN